MNGVIRRLYVHNFRCLDNFELPISGLSPVLLIGKNGSGKTAIGSALEIFQQIARGTNRVGNLVRSKDFAWGRSDAPMRLEIELELAGEVYTYGIAFEYPEGFREPRVFEEKLAVGHVQVYNREKAQVSLTRTSGRREASFFLDWHLAALPIIQEQSEEDPLSIVKQCFARMVILRPIPALISGDSQQPRGYHQFSERKHIRPVPQEPSGSCTLALS